MKKHVKNWKNSNSVFGQTIQQLCFKLLLPLLIGAMAVGNALGQCPCPTGPNNFNIGADGATTTLGQSGLPTGGVTGACIFIKGKLKISSSYTFDGCTITMGTGAEIEMVPSGQPTLTIKNNTVLAGCTTMWKGISLGTGARINMEGSTIRDAQYAIKLVNTCFYRLVNNVFDANYVGVFVPAPVTGVNQINGLVINNVNPFSGNSFQRSGTYRGAYAGQTPPPSFAPYAGVLFNSVSQTTIGNPMNGSIVNHFNNLRNGIVDNLGNNNIYSGLNVSNLISASIVEGAGVFILKNAGLITVRNSTMTGVRYGVYGDKPKALSVLENNISTINTGIYLSSPTKGALIQGNTINNSLFFPSSANCITILQSSNGATSPHSILNNVLSPRKDGVSLQNINGKVVVSGNTITIPANNNGPNGVFGQILSGPTTISNNTITKAEGTNGGSGINLTQSTNAQITDNHINTAPSASNNSALLAGVQIADSPNSLYCCNQVNFSSRGFSFFGTCNDTKFANTSFGNHNMGTHRFALLVSAGQISPQYNTGNDWTSAVDFKHAKYQGDANFIPSSIFYTNQALVPGGLSKIEVPVGANPGDWFKFQDTDPTCGAQMNCGVPLFPLTGEGDGNDINGGELTVADLSALTVPNTGYIVDEVLNWKTQRYLYQKLLDYPGLSNWSLLVNNFFNNAQNGLIGKFQSVNKGIRELGGAPTSLAASYDQVLKDIGTETNPSQLEQLVLDLEQLEQQIADWKAGRIVELMAELNSLATTTAYQQDEKDVLLLYLQTVAQDVTSFTPGQESFIESLSNKCALEGGPGVYWARMLRQYYNPGWDWQDDCLPLAYRSVESGSPTSTATTTASLYPNPADGTVSISFNEPMEEVGFVTVYDFQGKALLTCQVLSGATEMSLNTSKLPNGFYAVRISAQNNLVNTYKLVVEH